MSNQRTMFLQTMFLQTMFLQTMFLQTMFLQTMFIWDRNRHESLSSFYLCNQ